MYFYDQTNAFEDKDTYVTRAACSPDCSPLPHMHGLDCEHVTGSIADPFMVMKRPHEAGQSLSREEAGEHDI